MLPAQPPSSLWPQVCTLPALRDRQDLRHGLLPLDALWQRDSLKKAQCYKSAQSLQGWLQNKSSTPEANIIMYANCN